MHRSSCSINLCQVGVLNDPLLHVEAQPQRVDAESNNGKQEPLDVIAEELSTGTVKCDLATVNGGVLSNPGFLQANCPRSRDSEGKADDETLQDGDADQTQKTACEFRFHD